MNVKTYIKNSQKIQGGLYLEVAFNTGLTVVWLKKVQLTKVK